MLSVRDLGRAVGAANCDTTSVTTENGTVGTDSFSGKCGPTAVGCR
jgi:hypothetical protein